MAKSKSDTFILELKLLVEDWQSHILEKRFEIARKMYNATLSYALKQLQLMKESKEYRKQLRLYREIKTKLNSTKDKKLLKLYKQELKSSTDELKSIRIFFGLSEYGFHNYIKKHQHNYEEHMDSLTSQKIASAVWKSIETVIFKGSKAHFKKYGGIDSVEGKNNTSGIKFRNNKISWNGLELPVIIRKNDLFAEECLSSHKIKYCRIKRKVVRGKDTYYLQLVMDGIPPAKKVNSTGEFRHKTTPHKRVGIDIGTSTVAVSSEDDVFLKSLAPKVPSIEKEKIRLLRKLDRSRRNTNPDNFNTDGTVKRGIKLTWKYSNNYLKTLNQLKEFYRKKAVYLKEQHSRTANYILALGDEVYVETMNFKGLAKRTKETKINKKGKFQRKKRFGKSIGNYAPALLVRIINQKLNYLKTEIYKVNTYTFKASQYNHATDSYKKKTVNQRWNTIGNNLVQRDLYSAFLLMNSEKDLCSANRERCIQTFDRFLEFHDNQMGYLKESEDKLPSSMGIIQVS